MQQGQPDHEIGQFSVPLFPLPNIVLLPHAVVPLHIFEERYKLMTGHAMAGDRRIAMALLCPGWEKGYASNPAIEPVVCVGKIVSCERLADGKYNFLLQGIDRARILQELPTHPYRQAVVEALASAPVLEIDLADERRRLSAVFEGLYGDTPLGRQFRQLLRSSIPTDHAADIIAFTFLEELALKQSLLADADIRQRVAKICAALESIQPGLHAQCRRHGSNPNLN